MEAANRRSEFQDRILDAAETVIAARGYRGGTLNDIAQEAGYTRAGLLHHYPSKEAVLMAILERRDEQVFVFEMVPPSWSVFDLLDHLTDSVQPVLDRRVLVQVGHTLAAEAASEEHPAHEWYRDRERRLRTDLAGAVDRAKERGELSAEADSELLAALILSTFEGLESQWLLDDTVDVIAGVEQFAALFRSLRIR